MDSIAVTKPNMAVTNRDRLGLSLFGLLSLAFGDEVRSRSAWQTGLYREVPLELLEEQETAPESAAAERPLQLDVDLKVVLETLKKENAKADKRQEKVVERILERVYLLEKQVSKAAPAQAHVNVHWQPAQPSGRLAEKPNHAAADAPRAAQERTVREAVQAAVKAAGTAAQTAHPVQTGQGMPRRAIGTQAAAAVRQAQRAGEGRIAHTAQPERLGRLAAPLTPVTWSTAAPAGDGWKPHWQEEHPGFAHQSASEASPHVGGSILLPDQLRRRREQALAAAAAQEQGLEEHEQAERQFTRTIAALVAHTLAQQENDRLQYAAAPAGADSVQITSAEMQRAQTASAADTKKQALRAAAAAYEAAAGTDEVLAAAQAVRPDASSAQSAVLPQQELQYRAEPSENAASDRQQARAAAQQGETEQTEMRGSFRAQPQRSAPAQTDVHSHSAQAGQTTADTVETTAEIVQAADSMLRQAQPAAVKDQAAQEAAAPTPEPQANAEMNYKEDETATRQSAGQTADGADKVSAQADSQPQAATALPAQTEEAETRAAEPLMYREAQEDAPQGSGPTAATSTQLNQSQSKPVQVHKTAVQMQQTPRDRAVPAPQTGESSQARKDAAQGMQTQEIPQAVQSDRAAEQHSGQRGRTEVQKTSAQTAQQDSDRTRAAGEHTEPSARQRVNQTAHAADESSAQTDSQPQAATALPAQTAEAETRAAEPLVYREAQEGAPQAGEPTAVTSAQLNQSQSKPMQAHKTATQMQQTPHDHAVSAPQTGESSQTRKGAAQAAQTQKQTQKVPQAIQSNRAAEQHSGQRGRTEAEPSGQKASAQTAQQDSELTHAAGERTESLMRQQTDHIAHTADESSAQADSQPQAATALPAQTAEAEIRAAEPLVYHETQEGVPQAGARPTAQAAQTVPKQHSQMPRRTANPAAAHTMQSHAAQIAAIRPMPLPHAAAPVAAVRPMEPFTYAPQAQTALPGLDAEGSELAYLPVQTQQQSEAPPKKQAMDSSYIKTLPEWAQRFLQQNAEPGSGAAAHQTAPAGQQPPRQIEWTAPNAVPAGTPHIVFKEQAPKETAQPPQAPRLSDSELRRAADKVYHMIEERLRKELRRSGR